MRVEQNFLQGQPKSHEHKPQLKAAQMICRDYSITNIYWPQRQERCQKPVPGLLGAHDGAESDAKVSALYVMQCHLGWLPLRIGAIKDKANLKWLIIYWRHLVPLILLRMSRMTVNQIACRALYPPGPCTCVHAIFS